MRTATKRDYRERIVAAVAYLAEHLDDAPDLAAMASVGGYSPFWFHRVFVAAVGETPAEISRRMRLERAAWRLRTTDLSLSDLAFEAGFADQPAFTRAFRNAYGIPPGRFRAEGMPAHEIPAVSEIHFCPTGRPYRIDLPHLERIPMNIEFVELEPRPYAYVRHHGPYPNIGATFDKLTGIAGPAGLIREGALFIGVYHDDPGAKPPEELQSDAGLAIEAGGTVPNGLETATIPGGRYAKGIHRGSFEKMGDSWGEFMGAIQESGTKPRMGSPFELYVSDMETTPVEDLITELYVAIESPSR